ncbi:MAG: Ig-like domain-containing protein [Bacteroidaceae bacterium]|nr:Ig-like domain-containing protein [Bacteroidaceae bacterium]
MKQTNLLAILLLMVAGLQTSWAQKMIVRTTDSKTAKFNVSKVEDVVFTESEPINVGHKWVDLGLPSGTLWATCNIGASKPEEYGDYFAWGETEPKDNYVWETYKWCNGSSNTITKYCTQSDYGYNGFTDGKTELDPEDDAAVVNWGSEWQMPSIDQIKELLNDDYTKTAWTTQNGVKGRLVRSKSNGNCIFLPAAGYCNGSNRNYAGSEGYYWSRSLKTNYTFRAYDMDFDYDYINNDYVNRPYGRSVRPVYVQNGSVLVTRITLSNTIVDLPAGGTYSLTATVQPEDATNKNLIWSSSDTGVATVDQAGNVTALANGVCTITCSAMDGSDVKAECQVLVMTPGTFGTSYGHGWIDLGLPSGTIWATCNVGASSPEEFGDYFAWGETSPKSEYSWSTYKWCNGSWGSLTKYCTDGSYGSGGFTDGTTELDPSDDAATVNWGSQWQMPSKEQRNELVDNCTCEFIWVNGNRVARITGPNGNFILLPTALYYDGVPLVGHDENAAPEYRYCNGFYWTRSLEMMGTSGGTYEACCITFGIGTAWYLASYGDLGRNCGLSVRPVLATQSLNSVSQIVLSEIPVTMKSGETKQPVATDFPNDAENKNVALESSEDNEADEQTALTQKMVVRMKDNQTVEFNMSKLEEVAFTEEEPINDDMHGIMDGHEWIDLGLPSGTLWATCNVGANSPEEYGDYFAWGETVPKDYYDGTTYFDLNNDGRTFKKYNNDGGKTELYPADDAATANWGAPWRMPTSEQIKELCNNCTQEMIQQNGVNGILLTGPNGNTIFLPAAGYHHEDWLLCAGSEGYYWTSSLSDNDFGSDYLFFGASSWRVSNYYRYHGRSVRAVYVTLTLSDSSVAVNRESTTTVSITSGFGNYTVLSSNESIATAIVDDDAITITGLAVGTAIITVTDTQTHQTATVEVKVLSICPDGNHPHVIDLGLPSGTLWATCNIGANSPEEYGDYFAWGETEPKDEYNWSTYKWMNAGQSSRSQINKYTFADGQTDACWYDGNGNFIGDNKKELDSEDDAATANWGSDWQMPNVDQIEELINSEYTTTEWTTQGGVNGRLITSKSNGNSIFLPAAGYRVGSYLLDAGLRGYYWSRSLDTHCSDDAYYLYFSSGYWDWDYYSSRDCGRSVRPVRVQE